MDAQSGWDSLALGTQSRFVLEKHRLDDSVTELFNIYGKADEKFPANA